MHIQETKPARTLLTVCVALLVGAATGCDWQTQATKLRTITKSQSDGDSPYVAVIHFRSTFGVPGSSTTRFLDRANAEALGDDLPPGSEVTIPAHHALSSFGEYDIRNPSNADLGVTFTGMFLLAMESDKVGWNPAFGIPGLRHRLQDTEDCIQETLENEIETEPWSPQAFLPGLQAIAASAGDCLNGDGGGGGDQRPRIDDPMGVVFVVNVGVTKSYADSYLPILNGFCDPFDASFLVDDYDPEADFSIWASTCVSGERTLTFPVYEAPDANPGYWEIDVVNRWDTSS